MKIFSFLILFCCVGSVCIALDDLDNDPWRGWLDDDEIEEVEEPADGVEVEEESCEEKYERVLNAVEKTVKDKNRLYLWTSYLEAKKQGLEFDTKCLRKIESLLDGKMPYDKRNVVEKVKCIREQVEQREQKKSLWDSFYWYVSKSTVKHALVTAVVALGASLIGGYIAGTRAPAPVPAREYYDGLGGFEELAFLTAHPVFHRDVEEGVGDVFPRDDGASIVVVDE